MEITILAFISVRSTEELQKIGTKNCKDLQEKILFLAIAVVSMMVMGIYVGKE
jgi:hypothetical protein